MNQEAIPTRNWHEIRRLVPALGAVVATLAWVNTESVPMSGRILDDLAGVVTGLYLAGSLARDEVSYRHTLVAEQTEHR